MTKQSVWEIYKEILDEDLIEDRREYSEEDLQRAYPTEGEEGLTKEEVHQLHRLIQGFFDPKENLYRSQWDTKDSKLLAENITESIHQDFDGWSDEEKVTIQLYLNDLGVAMKHSRK